jgi:glycosyltransferase involved in cell wall biosynthesis
MKLVLVTDAWSPQVNGVVTTLVELVAGMRARGHEVEVIHPYLFPTRPCPGYAGIDLALGQGRSVAALLQRAQPDCVHIATEGPLGWAARSACKKFGWAFSSAYHTRFPELLNAAARVPLRWGYALFRVFHSASNSVMVPTRGTLSELLRRGFVRLRPWTHGVDTQLFRYQPVATEHEALDDLPRPWLLYVGRVSYEKNLEAFLSLKIEGSKIICGDGPVKAQLAARYPDARFLGVLPRTELARVYASADVFAFPSVNETFGLVMLEAMACGTPVAAFPADGPREVLGNNQGGVLHESLGAAIRRALLVPRHDARLRALTFSWAQTVDLFESHLVRTHQVVTQSNAKPSRVRVGHPGVTALSRIKTTLGL